MPRGPFATGVAQNRRGRVRKQQVIVSPWIENKFGRTTETQTPEMPLSFIFHVTTKQGGRRETSDWPQEAATFIVLGARGGW